MDLDDDELRATKELHNLYKDEKDLIIEAMAHDLLHLDKRAYYFNVFSEKQLIDCYRRKVKGDSEWNITM